jgi:hypothetical protein
VIPVGSTIKSASITLNVVDASESEYQVYALNRDWSEEQVTWNFYGSGSEWAESGADGSADRSNVVLGTFRAPSLGNHMFTLNAAGVATLQDWVDHPSNNHGTILLNPDAVDGIDFSCSEATTIADRPMLNITYTH